MKTGFFRALWLLRDYLPDIVIGGGWVPMIYYHYVMGDKTKEPIRTRDIDFLLRENVPIRGESRSALLREAIETVIEGENQIRDGSCLDLAKDLAGCVNGPEDLSFNKRRMDGYGQ